MLISSGSYHMGTGAMSGDLEDQAARVYRKERGGQLLLEPKSEEEPLRREFRCKFSFREGSSKGGTLAWPEQLLVTATRLLMIVPRSPDKKGIQHFTVHSVRRADVPVVSKELDRHGKIKALTIQDTAGSAAIHVSFVNPNFGGFDALLQWLDPSSVAKLDHAAADAARVQRQDEQEAAAKSQAHAADEVARQSLDEARRRFAGLSSGPGRTTVSSIAGSVVDHRRTFHYRVAAPPARCVEAFENAFHSGGGVVARAKWEVQKEAESAVAVYGGRKGLVALTTAFSQTASAEQEGALGSTVRFQATARDETYTYCSMWLDEVATTLGFTNDGRFFRPYMRAVQAELVKLDPSVLMVKE